MGLVCQRRASASDAGRARAEGGNGGAGPACLLGRSAVESWALAHASRPVRVSAWERAEGEEVGRSRVGSGREGSELGRDGLVWCWVELVGSPIFEFEFGFLVPLFIFSFSF